MPCFEMHEIKLGSLNHKLRLQDETQDGKSVKSNANKIKIWGNFIQTLISWIIWGLVDWFKHILLISEGTGRPRNYISSQWADNVSVMFVLRLLLIMEISCKWWFKDPNPLDSLQSNLLQVLDTSELCAPSSYVPQMAISPLKHRIATIEMWPLRSNLAGFLKNTYRMVNFNGIEYDLRK